ncbi:MAG: sugar ABC transporter permease [Clostridia bacterium]|nr:sugar ABC transporter permease [Clostridia bacterium]
MTQPSTRRADRLRPYLFIAPAMIFLCVFVLYPCLNMIYLSFTSWNLVSPQKAFVGISNYTYLFKRKDFLAALRQTFQYTIGTVLAQGILSILIATWLKKATRVNNFLRGAIFMPHVIALLSVAMIWYWLMDEKSGLLNMALNFLGFAPCPWLQSSRTAMMSLVIVSCWKSLGYHVMIIYAALQGIPNDIYEAAELDNAGKASTFFKITFPMISPQAFLVLITMTIGSFRVFETIRIMTGGGPGTSTQVLVYYIYQTAFSYFKVGLASSAGVVLLWIVGVMTAFYFLALSKRVHYQ